MKGVLVVLVVAAAALAGPISDSDNQDEACLREFKVANANIDDIFNSENYKKPDPDFKCYVNCVLQGLGFLDDMGHLNRTSDLGYIDLDDSEQVESFIKCETAYVTGNICERAYQTAKCISGVEAAVRVEKQRKSEIKQLMLFPYEEEGMVARRIFKSERRNY